MDFERKKSRIILFSLYSYFLEFLHFLLDCFPYFFRNPIFKLFFKKYGRNCSIDYKCYFRCPRKIYIGNNVSINRGVNIYGSLLGKNVKVIIGNNVAIGPEVSIFAAGHDYAKKDLPDVAETVRIGDFVWIGGRSVILPGVKIGEGAVIGAGSIVTKDIPPYTVAVGSPARVIKERILKND